MSKPLSEMSLEELWQLFPIFLTEHQVYWHAWYAEEARQLKKLLPEQVKLHHIGSTAIDGIWAKPIVDILAEVPGTYSLDTIKDALVAHGYLCMSESKGRISLNKGYTEQGFAEQVFHLHLRYYGDNDELYFRDYMKEHPLLAKQYEALKLSLWEKYPHNRDQYTDSKTDFIAQHTRAAKQVYGSKYA